MFVNPEPVRAAKLFVHEARRWFPGGNFRSPSNRETADAQLMIDQRPAADLDRSGCDRAKLHPRRCDRVEVRGVRKESEHLVARPWQPELRFKLANFHQSTLVCVSVGTASIYSTMLWQGRRESENIEDERGSGGGRRIAVGGGIGGVILVVAYLLLGGDPQALLESTQTQSQVSANRQVNPNAPKDEATKFVAVVLAD